MKFYIVSVMAALLLLTGCRSTSMLNQPVSVPSAQPDTGAERIILNPPESGHTGMSITWRTPLDVEESFVQWGAAQSNPVTGLDRFQEKKAEARTDTVTYEDVTSVFKSFHVQLSDLTPGETYMYRVGNGTAEWSEWIHFDLPAAHPDSAFTFIYLGDAQNDVYSQWSRAVRAAYAAAPNASFINYAGDLVNRGYNDEEWNEWFRAGSYIHRMVPSIMTPGNHEYDDQGLTPLWKTHFTLPENSPEGREEFTGAVYYVDYPAVRIISLDGTTSEYDPNLGKIQAEWLENVLQTNDKRWTIVTLHQPFFSTKESRDNPQIRDAFRSLLDEYGVDMVLQGHDHAYGRGMLSAGADQPGTTGTMYVVSVSGPKMYEIGNGKQWMQRKKADTQLYQIITIEGDELKFSSYTITGELFDNFTLQKSSGNTVLID